MADRKRPDPIDPFIEGFAGAEYESLVERLLRAFYTSTNKAARAYEDPLATLFGTNPNTSNDPITGQVAAGLSKVFASRAMSPGEWFRPDEAQAFGHQGEALLPSQVKAALASAKSAEDFENEAYINKALAKLSQQSKGAAKSDQYVMRRDQGGRGDVGVYGNGGNEKSDGKFSRATIRKPARTKDVNLGVADSGPTNPTSIELPPSLPSSSMRSPGPVQWNGPIMELLKKLGIE